MPFDRPTLSELRAQAAADINASLSGVDALLRYSNLGITGEAIAGAANGFYGYLDWIARQSVPFTATDEFLEGWAAKRNVTRKPATRAAGIASLGGTDGAIVPAGTPLTRADGFEYVSTEDVTIDDGEAQVPFRAIVAGAAGNAASGVSLTLGAGIAGVESGGTAAGAITGGADIEPDEELRSRMLSAYASPPQGGSKADYREWALQVPGVTRSWVNPSAMGPGTIVLLFMMDDAQADNDGFPQGTDGCASEETRDTAATGDQLALANAIFEKQPVTALVYAVAPTPNVIDIELSGIASASTATKSAIEAAVAMALKLDGVPGGLPNSVTNVSSIEAAIAGVAGTAGFVITAITASAGSVSPGAAGNITSDAGALPTLGTITYV